tara:strand:+ start:593 stop:766 length:174 start_codon:yes stop_codon:yes gene_type:complete
MLAIVYSYLNLFYMLPFPFGGEKKPTIDQEPYKDTRYEGESIHKPFNSSQNTNYNSS